MVNTDYQRGAYDSVTLQNIYFIIVFQKLVLDQLRHLRVTFSILKFCFFFLLIWIFMFYSNLAKNVD